MQLFQKFNLLQFLINQHRTLHLISRIFLKSERIDWSFLVGLNKTEKLTFMSYQWVSTKLMNVIRVKVSKILSANKEINLNMRIWITIVLICLATAISAKTADNNLLLQTVENAEYLSPIEKEIVEEINLFRSNPAKYAENFIAPLSVYYENKVLHYPGDKSIMTQEGVSALHECVKVLKQASPLPLMLASKGLSLAAKDHQKDQAKTGKTGHTGSDRSGMKERIERYGEWQVRIAENIAYGNSTARQVLIFLLIDDGVRSRGHRTNLLHPVYKTVGVAFGEHPIYQSMCVMDFAGGMIDK